jgi:phosphopantetheinyl transferase
MESQTPAHSPSQVPVIGLAHATADDLAVAETALHLAEREVLERLTVPKRRRDWLLGRLAAKRALVQVSPVAVSLRDVAIRRGEDGRPVFALPHHALAEWSLSLSHTGGWAVAIAAPYPIGIDLEGLRPINPATHRFFMQRSEQTALAAGAWGDDASLAVWGIKEAAFKLLGGQATGLHALCLGQLHQDTVAVRYAGGRVVAHWRRNDGFGLAIAHADGAPVSPVAMQDLVRQTLDTIETGVNRV